MPARSGSCFGRPPCAISRSSIARCPHVSDRCRVMLTRGRPAALTKGEPRAVIGGRIARPIVSVARQRTGRWPPGSRDKTVPGGQRRGGPLAEPSPIAEHGASPRSRGASPPMTAALTRAGVGQFPEAEARRLDAEGYLLLHGAIPADWLEPLRQAFEAGTRPSEQWPVPRGRDWRHAMVDLDPIVQRVCRLPAAGDARRRRSHPEGAVLPGPGRGPRAAPRWRPAAAASRRHRPSAHRCGVSARLPRWLRPRQWRDPGGARHASPRHG
ncbi:hypothetical protein BRAS3809_5900006 [Bradyrhizobium sp. STM 3809]|nr:hypothetical protein BRAS3809_5900006 [Bradyrhizobium sp. STM 3809]